MTIRSTISPPALLLLVLSGPLQSHSHVLIQQKTISKNSLSSLKWLSRVLPSTGAIQRGGVDSGTRVNFPCVNLHL